MVKNAGIPRYLGLTPRGPQRLARAMQFVAAMTKHMRGIVFALALTAACGSGDEQVPGSGHSSECGGFDQGTGFLSSAATGNEVAGAYCDASMLLWTYDVDTSTLRVRHTRTEMNCGAIPGVDLWQEEGVLQIVEREFLDDEPYGCQCVFDFDVQLEDVPPDRVALEIWQRKHYETEGKGMRIWTGTLDVSPGAGEIVVNDQETPWCDQDSL